MTQPTRGFGVVVNRPRSASRSARTMKSRSALVNITTSAHAGRAATARPANQRCALSAFRRRPAHLATGPLQLEHLLAEFVDALEVLVHRSEPDVRDMVHFLQLLHHHLADGARADFALAAGEDPLLDAI